MRTGQAAGLLTVADLRLIDLNLPADARSWLAGLPDVQAHEIPKLAGRLMTRLRQLIR
jgi:hypothetical protein